MEFNYMKYRYPSRREAIFARNGMVCTSQPLAAQAGLDILKQGGNAVDAAVATAAAMTVLEPTSNGIGGDAFALVWLEKKKELFGLNASGLTPRLLDADKVEKLGYKEMPVRGWLPVMVPGAPSAWAEMTEKYGNLTLEKNMEPAILYAEEGYPVTPVIAGLWNTAYEMFGKILSENEDADWLKPWFCHFAPEGYAPKAGELWKSEEMAATLKRIASSGARDFYIGELAGRIDEFSRRTGGYLRKEDLEGYWCEWVKPIHTGYRNYDVWEIPPNGDGIIALMALNILKNFEFDTESRESADTCHRQLEAMKLAFADGSRYVADEKSMKVTAGELLSESYGRIRSGLIGETARIPEAGEPGSGGTVYLCTADREGNMVSFIQSNYNGFGSGVVVPGTGISLQNRGCAFTLDRGSANCLEPGKKAFHTIIPGFLTKDGEAVGPFGVMGAFMQPQGHVQVLMNMIDFGLNPQEALDAPRWQWIKDNKVQVEPLFPKKLAEQLRVKGHDVEEAESAISFGRGEMILKNGSGVYCGAAEPRAGGYVAAW